MALENKQEEGSPEEEVSESPEEEKKEDINLKYSELELKYKELEERYSELEREISELREYKSKQIKMEKDSIFSKFSAQLSEDEMSSIREVADSLSVSEIQEKLFSLVGKKNFELKPNQDSIITMGLEGFNNPVNKTGCSYQDILDKYIKK